MASTNFGGGAADRTAAAVRKASRMRKSRFSFLVSRWEAIVVTRNKRRSGFWLLASSCERRRLTRNEKRETRNRFLLISQRYHGIHFDRPTGWNQAGPEGHREDQQRGDGEGQGIGRVYAEEQF